jgi:16S rRNA (guanine527-N7)-methyltransferase
MNDGDSRVSIEVAVSSLVERSLESLGIPADPDKVQKLTDLVSLLARWAPQINLTGHRDPLDMTSRLVLDAVAMTTALPELGSLSSLADLGSGAGFPGLPIAIIHPHLEVHLVDSRRKRNHFQREAKRRLDLPRVDPILGRSDEVEAIRCDAVVAQAMTQPDRALELMIPWAKPGGIVVLPASEGAESPQIPREAESLEERSYLVPAVKTRRTLWVARMKAEEPAIPA